MKKNLAVLLSIFTLCSLTACESESYSTSETNIEFNTSTESSDIEATAAETETTVAETTEETETESSEPENKYDTEAYNLRYHIDEDGTFIVYVPETDEDYWRQLTFDGSENTMEFVDDEIDEDSIYYVELQPTITDGTAQAILGHFTAESDEEAFDYAIFDLSIEDGKVTDVIDSGFTSSLDGIIE